MNVLIVTEVYRPGIGGIQTAIDMLITGLINNGDNVTVLTGSPKGWLGYYEETDEVNGATILRVPAVRSFINRDNNRITIFPRRFIRRYFQHSRPDVIHMMTPTSWLHFAVANFAHRLQIPIVVSNHTMMLNFVMNMKHRAFADKIAALADRYSARLINKAAVMTAPTHAALKQSPGGVKVPLRAISNGVDAKFYSPGAADERLLKNFKLNPWKLTVVYTGRLDGEKRIDLLIEAMKRPQLDDAQLVIIGKGLELAKLQEQAQSLGGRCIFTGFVSDEEKLALLRKADVFATVGPAELQCIAALEALACGTPIVVADQVALPELLDDSRNGRSFQYPNIDDLAKQLGDLLADKALRKKMSRRARQWILASHAHERTIAQYRELYREVIDNRLKTF